MRQVYIRTISPQSLSPVDHLALVGKAVLERLGRMLELPMLLEFAGGCNAHEGLATNRADDVLGLLVSVELTLATGAGVLFRSVALALLLGSCSVARGHLHGLVLPMPHARQTH